MSVIHWHTQSSCPLQGQSVLSTKCHTIGIPLLDIHQLVFIHSAWYLMQSFLHWLHFWWEKTSGQCLKTTLDLIKIHYTATINDYRAQAWRCSCGICGAAVGENNCSYTLCAASPLGGTSAPPSCGHVLPLSLSLPLCSHPALLCSTQ